MGTLILLVLSTILGGFIAAVTHNVIWMGAFIGFIVSLAVTIQNGHFDDYVVQ